MTTEEVQDFRRVLETNKYKKILKYVDGLAEAYKDNGYHEGYNDGYQSGAGQAEIGECNDY